MDYTLLVILIFLIYWTFISILKRKKRLDGRITAIGPLLMIRTSKGLNFLEKLSKNKKFWRTIANLGTPSVFAGMFFMFTLIVLMNAMMISSPPPPSPVTNPRNALLIPGVNEYIPLVWGLIGLIVTLIVHEFSHAILCRVENVKVKALGLLMILVPIGGFAEPDEKELSGKNSKTTRIQRIRIYSAGVISNFITATFAFAIFFILLNSVTPVPGVYVVSVYKDFPAYEAGIREGMSIIKIDGDKVLSIKDFAEKLRNTTPGQIITVTVLFNDVEREYKVKLTKAPKGDHGFMGVVVKDPTLTLKVLKRIPEYLYSPQGWLILIGMPLTFTGFGEDASMCFKPTGFWKNYGNLIFYLLNVFYWIGWLNFYVGLFNCLPAIPLDGGKVLHEVLAGILTRKFGEKGENISRTVINFLAIFIFTSIFLSILIPNLRLR